MVLFVARSCHRFAISIVLLFSLLNFSSLTIAASKAIKLPYKVLYTLPHNKSYFTQGLLYEAPYLYESTGLYKQSKLVKYKVEKNNIQTLRVESLNESVFAEGLALDGDNLVLLSYKQGKARVYNKNNLQYVKGYQYQGEGWGLTFGLGKFYMTNGSDQLLVRSKKDFSLSHRTPVLFNTERLSSLNELEWIKGYVAANIWYDPRIVLISPFSGQVVAYFDLSKLIDQYQLDINDGNVANGIAYDEVNNVLYVTGKRWPIIFVLKPSFEKLNNNS